MQRKLKIVVIDDESSVLISTTLMLRLLDYDFETFEDPIAALKYVNDNHGFDLILLDIMMPGLDGYGFLRELRQKGLKTKFKIILHTGIENQAYIRKCLKAGADDCLKKPYNRLEFACMLDKHLLPII